MRIAHITLFPDYSPGVFKKAEEKASVSRNFDFFIFNPFVEKNKDNLKIVKVGLDRDRILDKLYFKYKVFDILSDYDFSNYDWIILRYPLAEGKFNKFLNKYRKKIILEHHTFEEYELLSTGRVIDKFRYFNEKIRAKEFLSKAEAIIGVTEEIKEYELGRIDKKLPSKVISNGIKVASIPFTKFKKFDGKELNIIFVASFFYSWHGLDKILNALEKYEGEIKIILHLVGEISKNDKDIIGKFDKSNVDIKIYGRKYGKNLDDIFAISTIAISTIAISTKEMKEACPLKTREYIARGIPFIYGYIDSDLNGNEDFALKIDETRDINFNEIIEFVKKINKIDNLSQKMRDFALNKLDWKKKLEEMYDFIKSLKKGNYENKKSVI